jgi:hypothetical protein
MIRADVFGFAIPGPVRRPCASIRRKSANGDQTVKR